MDLVELFIRYAILPLLTLICTVGWHMYKRQDLRIDNLEEKQNDLEKIMVEIRTDYKHIGHDLRDIKEDIKNLIKNN